MIALWKKVRKPLGDLVDCFWYSKSEQRFHESVGITPKRFCRIQRFQTVPDRMVEHEPIQWVNVALDNGYFDQTHLIRNFREFTGVTPMEYQPVEAGQKNHMVPKS